MSLKIIAGKFKNHSIKTPEGVLTKPTMSLMRKSVFDICQAYVNESEFLDVFACSGAMGIEAISRGALHATFIDNDKRSTKCIEQNMEKLGIRNQGTVLCIDATDGLKKLAKEGRKFSLVYIDPPYTHLKVSGHSPGEILELLDSLDLLLPNALVFIEEAFPASLQPDKMELFKLRHKNSRKFSSSLLHQFTYSL
ncbi:MAG: 16S rRNA (guanine(966)-N(2))-methyltransferase RsmD [Chlamydiae bacterium]|nr:16S rRNA (guanine(966)-N(2))-methyltransferase RsmD [Chlamydiota bacterium]